MSLRKFNVIFILIAVKVFHFHIHFSSVLRACLYQPSVSTLRKFYDDTSDNVLIENNEVARKWVAAPIWSDSIVFSQNRITSLIAELSQH